MKGWSVAILILVFHTASSKKDTKMLKKIPTKFNCSKIQCPAVEMPICARLMYRNTDKYVHVVMINKCEMKYTKCHQDLEAKIVPMSYCSHNNSENTPAHKRSKRQAESDASSEDAPNQSAPAPVYSSEDNKVTDINSDEVPNQSASAPVYITEDKTAENELSSDEVDEEQYHAECPTVCPSRDVMVCARCQHGIYMTFLSICHMRMTQCNFKNDTIELASRSPCLALAPFLTEDLKPPQGRVTEPDDMDIVLQYIKCREINGFKTGEKCKFGGVNTDLSSNLSKSTNDNKTPQFYLLDVKSDDEYYTSENESESKTESESESDEDY